MKSALLRILSQILSLLVISGPVITLTPCACASAPERLKPSDFHIKANGKLNEARDAYKKKDYAHAEQVLKPLLDDVRTNEPKAAILGKYLGLLSASCYFEKKYRDSVKYAEEALKVDALLPADESVSASAPFGNHSYAGLSYKELERLPEAASQLQAAVDCAQKAPKGSINDGWLRLCYETLAAVLRRQGKYGPAKAAIESMHKAGLE